MTGQQLINQAFFDMGAIASGETPSTAESDDGLIRLNQLLASLSTEGVMVPLQVMQTFNLSNGVSAYTLGSGGSFATTGALRAMKVTAWRAISGLLVRGGAPLSMAEYARQLQAQHEKLAGINLAAVMEGQIAAFPASIVAPVPALVATDTAYPLVNVRIWPPPSAAPGTLELAYWTPLTAIATLATAIALPEGWERMLHFNLAVDLYPQYGRAGGIPPELAANAQNSKLSIMSENSMERPQQAQQAPPQQQ